MTSLLVVEDDPDMQLVLRLGLEEGGYSVSVADDGPSAIDMFHTVRPDVVIIDVILGHEDFDGFEVCRRLRKVSDVPIIFLTVRSEDVDQLIGLAIGADDYLVKPVSPRVLCARVHTALEHCRATREPSQILVDGDMRIDRERRSVTVNDRDVDLTRIEFDILLALASYPERVLSRDEITSQVWGDWFGSDAHLDVHMSRLRKKILDAGGTRVGHSVRGLGFRLH